VRLRATLPLCMWLLAFPAQGATVRPVLDVLPAANRDAFSKDRHGDRAGPQKPDRSVAHAVKAMDTRLPMKRKLFHAQSTFGNAQGGHQSS